jgi:alpha-L-rhamnosidase
VLGRGEWIGGHGQLRGDFEFPTDASHVTRARMYATGVGAFYAFVNGERVGDDIMSPPQSVYHSRVLYTTYNVTQQLVQSGGTKHTVGVLLGNVKWG